MKIARFASASSRKDDNGAFTEGTNEGDGAEAEKEDEDKAHEESEKASIMPSAR